jgi:hypothetical protein
MKFQEKIGKLFLYYSTLLFGMATIRLIYRTDVLLLLLLLFFKTAIGLTPGGSSTVHVYTKNSTQNTEKETHITIKRKIIWEVRAVPRICELYSGICLTTEEKARKPLSYGRKT